MIQTRADRAAHPVVLRLAALLSVVGHPFVLAPLALLVVARRYMGDAAGLRLVVLTSLVTIVPVTVIILRRVRSGAWTNFDVSVREHRPVLYGVALLLTGATAFAMTALDVPGPIVRGVMGALLVTLVAFAVNFWLKISLHSAYGAFIATSLLRVAPGVAAALLLFVPLVAVSRVILGRHSRSEVACGLLLGGIAGLCLSF